MNIPGLTTAHIALEAIPARRMVMHGAVPGSVVTATNTTGPRVVKPGALVDPSTQRVVTLPGQEAEIAAANASPLIIGVTTAVSCDAGDHVDVIRGQLALVTYGGTIKAGQPLVSDSEGRAVPAAAGDWYLGFAECDGEENDIGSVWIAPGQVAADTDVTAI